MTDKELMHFGVKGMKWGKRKIPSFPAGQNIRSMRVGKQKDYSPDNNLKVGATRTVDVGNGLRMVVKDKKPSATMVKIKKKLADRKERKDKIKSTFKEIEKNTSTMDQIIFSSGVRKKAAKYVVDNNMTVKDAVKLSKKEASIKAVTMVAVNQAVSDANRNM